MSSVRPTTFGPMTEKRARKYAAAQARAAALAAAQQAAIPPPAAPRTRRQKQPKESFSPPQVGMAQVGARPSGVGAALGTSKSQLVDAFTKQDQAILAYLEGVCHPWTTDQVRAPLVVGGFSLETDTFQMIYEGEAYAGTGGIAYVQLAVSGWAESGNSGVPADQYEAFAGGTQGNLIFASGNSVAGATGFPAPATAASLIHVATPARSVEAAWNATTRYRTVSVGLEVFSDASVNNATGKVMICSSVRPAQYNSGATPSEGGLAGNTFQQIVTTPRKELERAEMPLAGWASGTVLRAFAVPAEPICFTLLEMAAVGAATTPYTPPLGAIATGMTTGQSFSWRAVYNYEAITEVSNKTSTPSTQVLHAGADRISNAIPHVKFASAIGGPTSAIEAMPVAAHALANEMSAYRPSHAATLVEMGKRPALLAQVPGVSEGIKNALGKVASSGVLSNIPFVGGVADLLAKGAHAIWNLF